MYRSILYRTHPLYQGDSGGASGGNSPQNQDQSQRQDDNKNKMKNNKDDNVDDFTDIWQDDDNSQQTTQQNQNNQNNNNQNNNNNNQNQPSAQEHFNNYVKGLDFSAKIDPTKMSEELQNGDFTSFNAAVTEAAQKAYKQSMIDANRIMDSKITKAVDDAVKKSTSTVTARMVVSKMNDALPFTKSPEISPVAEAVLQQFTKKGQDPDTAIASVKKFFQKTANISAKDLGMQVVPQNRPGTRTFANAAPQNQNTGDDDSEDWMDILSGT